MRPYVVGVPKKWTQPYSVNRSNAGGTVAAELNVNIHYTLDYIATMTLYIFADEKTIKIR